MNQTVIELKQQYDELRKKFVEAVGDSADKKELDNLKRQLEALASRITKAGGNHKA